MPVSSSSTKKSVPPSKSELELELSDSPKAALPTGKMGAIEGKPDDINDASVLTVTPVKAEVV